MRRKNVYLLFALLVFGFFAANLQGEIKDVLSNDKTSAQQNRDAFVDPFNPLRMPSDPFFKSFEDEMNRMFESFRGFKGLNLPDWTRQMHGFEQGRADVRIEGDNIVVLVDLPGHDKDKIDLRVKGRDLIISSERKSEVSEEEKGKFYRREISYGNFSRVIALPKKVIAEKATAKFKDGVLKVTLPIDKTSPDDENGFKVEIN
ncbi:MAG: Hsp20/alpha crystallin family protein [Candidatus Rifleibacteriota bacterium]